MQAILKMTIKIADLHVKAERLGIEYMQLLNNNEREKAQEVKAEISKTWEGIAKKRALQELALYNLVENIKKS